MVKITAPNMLAAQGAKLTKAQLAALRAKADRRRAKHGDFGPEAIDVPVYDHQGALIGHMRYTL
ncbi:hypothetical protein GCM10010413_51960 [Promicromonospora sukumoe]|uniref:Uncharacterized protein n=1 Tax=Promicromonospora sukumoe TaxID=88382 RepID=A0A7W3PGF6_9MICO|nr:hypothetical protein [Promicromonospora sukumoe]MBA8810642.1 hypothetical protein [Promicromonospora sukumoe]